MKKCCILHWVNFTNIVYEIQLCPPQNHFVLKKKQEQEDTNKAEIKDFVDR